MRDLHSALKTEQIARADASGIELVLARLRYGKDDTGYSLHARPSSHTMSGVQTTDLLGYLGFKRAVCSFVGGGQCYARVVSESFTIEPFAVALSRGYKLIQNAEGNLDACGIFLEKPEGSAFFYGREHRQQARERLWNGGDGHTAPKVTRLNETDDNYFKFMFTWIDAEGKKGWTTHYRPKETPLSSTMSAAMSFLKLQRFDDCPEFDFDPCFWKFFAYRGRDHESFDGGAGTAHNWFEAHPQYFTAGVTALMDAHAQVRPFGMSILAIPQENPYRTPAAPAPRAISPQRISRKVATVNAKTHVFVSYSHQDGEWLKRLQVHLKPLVRQGSIELWDDTKIKPGVQWRQEIEQAMSRASVAVLLVSADFLASDFVADNELPPLLDKAAKGGALILSVIVGPCLFQSHSTLSKYQAINSPDQPLTKMQRHDAEETLMKLAQAIADHIK